MVIHEMRWRMDSWHLCWLSMWILWRYLPLREMGINVEMQTLSHSFPSEGMLPCNHALIGWLHQLPSEQQPSPSFTEQWPSWYAGYDHEYFYRAYLCTHADGDSYLN